MKDFHVKDPNVLIKSTLAGVVAVGAVGLGTGFATTALAGQMNSGSNNMSNMSSNSSQMKKMQNKRAKNTTGSKVSKCYGVNAANKNDCVSPGHSCAGQDSQANDPNAYVMMPKGLCHKIAGGSLTSAKSSNS